MTVSWKTDGETVFINSLQCDEEGNYDALVFKFPVKDLLFVLWRDFWLTTVKGKKLMVPLETPKEVSRLLAGQVITNEQDASDVMKELVSVSAMFCEENFEKK